MCLIRNVRGVVIGLTAVLGVLAGCQRTVPPAVMSPINTTPMVVDEAMQARDWDRSTCVYASGATVAGGNGYLWQTHETIPNDWRRLTDVPVSLINVIELPVGVLIETPFGKEVYHGESVPPSYTAQPPLP